MCWDTGEGVGQKRHWQLAAVAFDQPEKYFKNWSSHTNVIAEWQPSFLICPQHFTSTQEGTRQVRKYNQSLFLFLNFIYLFIILFLAVLDLHFCARAFSSCGKRGPLFIAVRGPLTVAASLVEHRLQTRRLSNCQSLFLKGEHKISWCLTQRNSSFS